jgi:hypothetical protein
VEELVGIIAEIDNDENGVIDFEDFIQLVGERKVVFKYNKDDSNTIDAFVALGGNEDKTGHVHADRLRRFIDAFGLPINSEDLVRDMCADTSGLVDYEQFKIMMLALESDQVDRVDVHVFQIGDKTYSWHPDRSAENIVRLKGHDIFKRGGSVPTAWQRLHEKN